MPCCSKAMRLTAGGPEWTQIRRHRAPIGAKVKAHGALEPRFEVAGSRVRKGEAAAARGSLLGGPHGPAPYTARARGPGHIAGHGESLQRPPRAGIASTFFHTVNAGSVPWAMQTWGAGSLPVGALPGHCGVMGSIPGPAR